MFVLGCIHSHPRPHVAHGPSVGHRPQSLQEEGRLADTLIIAQWDQFWTSDPQNYEVINVCCFKLLILWEFVTAAMGNKYRQFHLREEINYFYNFYSMWTFILPAESWELLLQTTMFDVAIPFSTLLSPTLYAIKHNTLERSTLQKLSEIHFNWGGILHPGTYKAHNISWVPKKNVL